MPDPVDEPGERHPRDAGQRGLPHVAGAELVGRQPEAPPPLVDQVHHEAGGLQRGQQLVGRGSRQTEITRHRGRGHRPGLSPQMGQDRERLVGGRYLDRSRYRFRHPAQASVLSGIPDTFAPHVMVRHASRVSYGRVPATLVSVRPAPLSPAEVVAVARDGAAVALSAEAEHELEVGRKVVEALAHDTAPHYGVSTGFGALATRHIPVAQRAQLQRSLVRSHAAGIGPEVEREVVRALMLLRLSTLATGRTGVRPGRPASTPPCSPPGSRRWCREYGSLGCSGDLAPLAALRAGRHRRGHGPRRRRRARARRRRPRRRRDHAPSCWPRRRASR